MVEVLEGPRKVKPQSDARQSEKALQYSGEMGHVWSTPTPLAPVIGRTPSTRSQQTDRAPPSARLSSRTTTRAPLEASWSARKAALGVRMAKCLRHVEPLAELRDFNSSKHPYLEQTFIPSANAVLITRICTEKNLTSPVAPANPRIKGKKGVTEFICSHTHGPKANEMKDIAWAEHRTCLVPGTSVLVPCERFRKQALGASRFCHPPPTQTLFSRAKLQTIVDVKALDVSMPEFHGDNINHFVRDVAFLVSIWRRARAAGFTVHVGRPGVKKLNRWQNGLYDALEAAGIRTDHFSDVMRRRGEAIDPEKACRHAQSQKWSTEAFYTSAYTRSCSIAKTVLPRAFYTKFSLHKVYCYAQARKFSNVGFSNAGDMHELACAARAFCGLPAAPVGKRTLVFAWRAGGNRVIDNRAELESPFRAFAERMGWDWNLADLGTMSFCDQVKTAARPSDHT